MFLLSKSTDQEKALAIFNLHDETAQKKLKRDQFENMILFLVEIIFKYSEKFMDNEEGIVKIHHQITYMKVENSL